MKDFNKEAIKNLYELYPLGFRGSTELPRTRGRQVMPELLNVPRVGEDFKDADWWIHRIASLHGLEITPELKQLMENDLSGVTKFRYGYLLGYLLMDDDDRLAIETFRKFEEKKVFTKQLYASLDHVVSSYWGHASGYFNPIIAQLFIEDQRNKGGLVEAFKSRINSRDAWFSADCFDIDNKLTAIAMRCGYSNKKPSRGYEGIEVCEDWLRPSRGGTGDCHLNLTLQFIASGAMCHKMAGYQWELHRINPKMGYNWDNTIYLPWQVHVAVHCGDNTNRRLEDWGWLA